MRRFYGRFVHFLPVLTVLMIELDQSSLAYGDTKHRTQNFERFHDISANISMLIE